MNDRHGICRLAGRRPERQCRRSGAEVDRPRPVLDADGRRQRRPQHGRAYPVGGGRRGGTVAVSYYDYRFNDVNSNDGLETALDPPLADGGAAFGPDEMLGATFDTKGPYAIGYFLGDYDGLASIGDSFSPFWTSTEARPRKPVLNGGVDPQTEPTCSRPSFREDPRDGRSNGPFERRPRGAEPAAAAAGREDQARRAQQPLPHQATINLVALNPQPLPPRARIRLVALNPQPLPPKTTVDFVALNPQPLPPSEPLNFVAVAAWPPD